MSRCALKKVSKKDASQDVLEERGKDDTVAKLRSVFEIRRPAKSPSSTLKKSKSTSVIPIPHTPDEDEKKDKMFIRNSGSRSSIRSSHKLKKVNHRQTFSTFDKSRNNSNDMSSVKETGTKPKREYRDGVSDDLDFVLDKNLLQKFLQAEEKLNETDPFANHNKSHDFEGEDTSSQVNTLEKKFTKNYNKSNKTKTYYQPHDSGVTNPSEKYKSSKEIISQKQSKEGRKAIKSFVEAECEGETETYRRSLVLQMDLEVAKMKLDGFIDNENDSNNAFEEIEDVHYSKVSRYKQLFEGMFQQVDEDLQMIQSECGSTTPSRVDSEPENDQKCDEPQVNFSEDELSDCQECVENSVVPEFDGETSFANNDTRDSTCNNNPTYENYPLQTLDTNSEDQFGESLGDDLENGSFFVEAYNDDERELVIVEISLERRTVSFDKSFSFESIEKSFKNSDIVFQEHSDKSLNVINDPKELVNDNGELVSYGPDSNRSTMYSTTSRESDVFDTDDEGISMGNVEQRNGVDDNAYNNVRRETFCDHKGIVRIERVGYPETVHGNSFEEATSPRSPVGHSDSFTQKGTLSYIIDEIKSTEKKYVEDLHKVVDKYMPYIERHTPANLIGKSCYIFGNLYKLLESQKLFLDALDNCGEEVEDIIQTFIRFEHLFQLYPNYFKNKPRADVVLREFSPLVKRAQEKFKERLDLSAYLLTPLQRLGKYKLFLENIEKQLTKLGLPTENATMALEMIKREMSKGNDFVAIESIELSPINKSEYGSFKMREKFNIIKPRRFEALVFLFENIIVFTLNNQSNMENYIYCDSIKMHDLRIATFEDLTLHLTDFTKCKKTSKTDKYTYVLEAKTEKIKDTWRQTIEDMLWQQLLTVKENTLKMYQSKTAKKVKIPRLRAKSTGASTFYVPI